MRLAALLFPLALAGCWTAEGRARTLAARIEIAMTQEDVVAVAGPTSERAPAEPELTEVWVYRTRTSAGWKVCWWARFCTVLLCIPALGDLFGHYASEWQVHVEFGLDHRVERVLLRWPIQL